MRQNRLDTTEYRQMLKDLAIEMVAEARDWTEQKDKEGLFAAAEHMVKTELVPDILNTIRRKLGMPEVEE